MKRAFAEARKTMICALHVMCVKGLPERWRSEYLYAEPTIDEMVGSVLFGIIPYLWYFTAGIARKRWKSERGRGCNIKCDSAQCIY